MNRIATLIQTTAMILAVLIVGCSKSPTEMTTDDTPPTTGNGEVVMGPAGGTLRSPDGSMALTFPEGALGQETSLRLAPVAAENIDALFPDKNVDAAYRLEPAGLTFEEPVDVALAIDMPTEDADGSLIVPPRAFWLRHAEAEGARGLEEQAVKPLETTIEIAELIPESKAMTKITESGTMAIGLVGSADYAIDIIVPASQSEVVGSSFGIELFGRTSDFNGSFYFMHRMVDPGLVYLGEDVDFLGNHEFRRDVGPYRCDEVGSKTAEYFVTMYPGDLGRGELEPLPRIRLKLQTECECTDEPDEPEEPNWDEADSPQPRPEGARRWSGPRYGPPSSRQGSEDDSWVAIAGDEGVTLFDVTSGTPGRSIFSFVGSFYGVCRFDPPAHLPEDPSRDFGVLGYGPNGSATTFWVPEFNGFGMTQLGFGNVTDATNLDGVVNSPGVAVTNYTYNYVGITEFDDAGELVYDRRADFFDGSHPISAVARSRSFARAAIGGDILIAAVTNDPTIPGRLKLANSADGSMVDVGELGLEPRRVRLAGELAVISNFGSSELTLVRWTMDGATILGNVTVGDGPIGIDVHELLDGTFAVVSTGFNDGTYTVTHVTIDGNVLSNETRPVPASCGGPGHAIFLGGEAVQVLITCNETGKIVRLASSL